MATGVGLRQISLTQLNLQTPKTPDWCKNQEHISHRSPVIANFLLKFSNFRYRGNMGSSETNFTYTVKFADPENPDWCNNRGLIFYTSRVIGNFVFNNSD